MYLSLIFLVPYVYILFSSISHQIQWIDFKKNHSSNTEPAWSLMEHRAVLNITLVLFFN